METIGIKEMKITKIMLEKKCASYFGDSTVDKADVGFIHLNKQISNINAILTEKEPKDVTVDVTLPATDSTPEVRVKRKYTKKVKPTNSTSNDWGSYHTYGQF